MSESGAKAISESQIQQDMYLKFPAMLFGSMKVVRPAWRRLMNTALKQRNWGDSLDRLEYVPAGESDTLIQPCRALWGAGVPSAWRFTLVGEEFNKWSVANRERFSIEEYVPLLTSQMHRLWFALGTMGAENSLHPMGRKYSIEERKVMTLFCSSFVRWLPQIVALEHRFFYGALLPEDRIHLPTMRSEWSNTFVGICEGLGFNVDAQYVMNNQRGNLLSALLRRGVITSDGEGYLFTLS